VIVMSVSVLDGMYAAEAEYCATGDFAPLRQFFAGGHLTEVRPFYWDTAAIAAVCST
jgi:hypothetical protein